MSKSKFCFVLFCLIRLKKAVGKSCFLFYNPLGKEDLLSAFPWILCQYINQMSRQSLKALHKSDNKDMNEIL